MNEFDKINKIAQSIVYCQRICVVILIYIMHTALYGFVSTHHKNINFNLLTDLDKLFPFVPEMVYLYMSFYVVIVVSVFFLKTEEEFTRVILSIIGTLLLTYPFYYFFPANYPVTMFDATTVTTKFLKWCFAADIPNNTFPSLHVGLAFTIAFGIKQYKKKLGALYVIWAIGIALSTIMIRKHFLIDTFGGIVMATFSYNHFVRGRLINPILASIVKRKNYLVGVIARQFSVKYLSRNAAYLLITILRMK